LVATFARLLSGAGWELAAEPQVSFARQASARGKPVWVPDRLPRPDVARALAVVELEAAAGFQGAAWESPDRAAPLLAAEIPL
jgi:hypothetical protein